MPANTPKGIFGSLTKAALMKYQQSQGLEQTGAIGPKTQAAIAGQGATPNTPTTSAPSAPASATASSTTVPTKNLQLRDSGPQVSALQSLLGVTPTTGYFGLATYQALVKYQKAHNLPATGFYGPVTRATMQTK